jgi:hypothetical protein
VALSVAGPNLRRATMIITDPRPMSSAPLDGTPVRLFVPAGFAIASFWSVERSQKAFGDGGYRAGWFLLDDDEVEVDDPIGWEPLSPARIRRETVLLTAEPCAD